MNLLMGPLDSAKALHVSAEDSFQLCGFVRTASSKSRLAAACDSLKFAGQSWKTWLYSGEQGAKLSSGSIDRSQLSGFNSFNLQLNGGFTVSCSESSAFSEHQRSMFSVKDILDALGRTLFIVGIGLSLSPPSYARTVAPTVSEASAEDIRESASYGVKLMKENNGNLDAGTDTSHECGESSCNPERTTPNEAHTSETSEDRLHLSEAFWSGIPTPEGSLLDRLKAQLEMVPGDSRALEALLQAVLEQQDMLRALTVVETLLEIQPENWHWKLLKARIHELLGELSMAKQEYEELLSLHPLSARFLQGLASLLDKVGEQTQALELIQNALNQAVSEGKDVEARDLGVLLSQFHIQLGNFEDALHSLSSMIEQDPTDYRPYLCQGLAYALMNQMEKAKHSFDKYMEVCPPDALEKNNFDELLLKAKADRRMDALKKNAMKGTFRNRKKSKPMKHPSLFGNWNVQPENKTSE